MTAPEPISSFKVMALIAAATVPPSFLPDDPIGAFVLGIVGGLLRWSVDKSPWQQGMITIVTGMLVAVFCNGITIPGISMFVPDAYSWRITTLALGFAGVSVLGVFNDIRERLSKKEGSS